ncbi:MAG: hypothetical protein KatS3mg038_2923 [Candidatus Kapaibacterium sp.]|nr:MAG: hypothetical protein KatS3mg038_2912 [Candidatus Kapabacteria bacterium]GIV52402.1 MAG: hypothetical protein KatS3mg038_2923 [Candidatus Kapabacteria bacterium]
MWRPLSGVSPVVGKNHFVSNPQQSATVVVASHSRIGITKAVML